MLLVLPLAVNDSERVDVTHRIPSALTPFAAKRVCASNNFRIITPRPCHCQGVFAGRGFILFFLGFLGGGITSMVPPLALIFCAADSEK
jgi:hypothetical protein